MNAGCAQSVYQCHEHGAHSPCMHSAFGFPYWEVETFMSVRFLFTCECAHTPQCACGGLGHLVVVASLSVSCRSWGSNSGCQALASAFPAPIVCG